MKKILLILFCLNLSAQYCKVVYNVVPTYGTLLSPDFKSKNYSKFLADMIANSDEALKTMFYNLIVNDQNSIFEVDENKLITKNIIALTSAANDKYYIKQDSILELKNNRVSANLAVIISSRQNWIYFNEAKTIGGYKCLKAQIELPWRSGKDRNEGKPTYIVTAWYCPTIPIKQGPKGFGNLPGLILELQDDSVTFQATMVEFENVPIIPKNYLKKYTRIPQDKYLERIHEMARSMNFTK